jgi:DNA polymerase-4
VAGAAAIRRAAGLCLKRVDLTRRLRLLGVRVGSLARPGQAAGRAPRADRRRGDEAEAELPFEAPAG